MDREARRNALIYVSYAAGSQTYVNVYDWSGNLLGQIGGVNAAGALLSVSPNGDLYVPSDGAVYVFHKGSTTPFRTLNVPNGGAVDAVERGGAVYVSSYLPGAVYVYAAGQTNPGRTLQDPKAWGGLGLALDSVGNLYWVVENKDNSWYVDEFIKGQGAAVNTAIAPPGTAGGLAVDSLGRVAVRGSG